MSKTPSSQQQSFYNIYYTKPQTAKLIKILRNDVKTPSLQQHSFYNISYTKPQTANQTKELKTIFKSLSQTAKFLQRKTPSHKKTINQMPMHKTKKYSWRIAKMYPLSMTQTYSLCKYIPVIRVSSTQTSANKRQTSCWLIFQQPS